MSKHLNSTGLLLTAAMLLSFVPTGILLAQDRDDAHVDARTFGARGDELVIQEQPHLAVVVQGGAREVDRAEVGRGVVDHHRLGVQGGGEQ